MKCNRKILNIGKIIIVLWIFNIIFYYTNNVYAALGTPVSIQMRIKNYTYQTHFRPGETVTFNVTGENTGSNNVNYTYLTIALTNRSTGVATELTSAASGVVAPGATVNLSTSWTAQKGLYTVTIILVGFDPLSAIWHHEVAVHTVYGSEPIHVGRAVDSVSAFPNIIDLGVIPYGRYMYPNPIKIHWDFYLKNQLRKDQPWYMRIYTDNSSRYRGIEGTIYKSRKKYTTSKIWVRTSGEGSPSGLVSSDGKYTLPLKVWCVNFGPDWDEMGWNTTLLGPPPVNDDYVWKGPQLDDGKRDTDRGVWLWIPDYMDMTGDKRTWRRLIGQDRYDREYVTDNNPTGDFTLDSPFDIYLATEASPSTVIGKYTGKLIIEIYTP